MEEKYSIEFMKGFMDYTSMSIERQILLAHSWGVDLETLFQIIKCSYRQVFFTCKSHKIVFDVKETRWCDEEYRKLLEKYLEERDTEEEKEETQLTPLYRGSRFPLSSS